MRGRELEGGRRGEREGRGRGKGEEGEGREGRRGKEF